MKSAWVLAVLAAVVAMSWGMPSSPAECIILWTSELIRRVKYIVFHVEPTYYPGIPPIYTDTTQNGINTRPGVPIPGPVTPGGLKPTTPKPGGRKPATPKPGGRKPATVKPGGKPATVKPGRKPSSVKPGGKPATMRPSGGKPTTSRPTTKEPATTKRPTTPPTTRPPATTTPTSVPSIDDILGTETPTTKRRFYNKPCGQCPPKKVCLCPGVNF